MLGQGAKLALALATAGSRDDDQYSITTSDDERKNWLTPTVSHDPYARSYSTYSTTTTDDDEANELTPTASSDDTATIFSGSGYSSNSSTTSSVQQPSFTFRDCRPLNIANSVNLRDGHLFAVHFEDCRVGMFNIDNCIMLNVTFENCTFGHTTFSNIFMKDVVVRDCHFEDYNWQNGRSEGTTMVDLECVGVTDMCDEVPKELEDPDWLTNELDGTNELIRAIEAGEIKDVKPGRVEWEEPLHENKYGVKGIDDLATAKLIEWHELAGMEVKKWWQW